MQKPFMFIDWGDGWKSLNDPLQDIAVLAQFSVQWGVETADEQPDPSVMSFTLRDLKGWLTGRALTLAGARILVQISEQPTWAMLTDAMGTWKVQRMPLNRLHSAYAPPTPDNPDSTAITLFDGIISNGGTAAAHKTGWKLKLTASSRLLLWKRLAKQGPTSTDARWAGQHWVTTTVAARLAELNTRAREASAPEADAAGLETTGTPASYDTSDYPTQLDLLHRLYAHHPHMPLWYEVPHKDTSVIEYTPLNRPVAMRATTDGTLTITDQGTVTPAIPAPLVETDDDTTLTIPEPITPITLKAKKATADDDGVLAFEDDETEMGDRGLLPANLTATQSSLTMESDITTQDDTGGILGRANGTTWTPSEQNRIDAARWLETIDRRLTPETIVFDGRKIDPANRPELYKTSPPDAFTLQGARSGTLADDTSRPTTGGAYTAIGGILTFEWADQTPVLRNEVTLWPIPLDTDRQATWSDMQAWPPTWAQTAMSIAELGLVSAYDQPAIIDQPNWEGVQP